MAYIPRPKAGDLITEGLLNRIVDQFERFANLRSDSPYVRIESGPNGKLIELDLPQPTWALLSGSTSPYSWTEVYEGPSGTWPAMPSGDSGTAYEINGKSGLAGKVVPITWTSAGDWRFAWIGTANCGWQFVTTGCNGLALADCLVEIRQSGTLIDSCTTDGRISSATRTNGGAGGTNGTYTDGTFTGGGGSGGTFSYTISGGVVQAGLTVTNPGSGYDSAPTPVFGVAAGAGATATSVITASCRMQPPQGVYDATITPPAGIGYASQTASRTFTCSSSADVSVAITVLPDSDHVCIAACSVPVPKILFTTDGLGTHTLTWNGTAWVGTATVSTGVWIVETLTHSCTAGSGMTVTYNVNQSLQLTVGWRLSCCYTLGGFGQVIRIDYVYGDDTNFGTAGTRDISATGTVTISSCSPVSATTNVATTGIVNFVDQHFCGDSGTGNDTYAGFDTPGGGGLMAVTE